MVDDAVCLGVLELLASEAGTAYLTRRVGRGHRKQGAQTKKTREWIEQLPVRWRAAAGCAVGRPGPSAVAVEGGAVSAHVACPSRGAFGRAVAVPF